MKRIIGIGMLCCSMALGAGWTGVLVDAVCEQPGKPEACPVTAATRHFGIVRDGVVKKYFTVGSEADVRILAALADDQKRNGKLKAGSNVKVWFTGKPEGDKLALKDFALK
jgi:hypothetical protein